MTQVEFIEIESDTEQALLNFEVRHFINEYDAFINAKWRKGYGGKTLLVINKIKDTSCPMIIWSYCRPTEQYSRLAGILTAFQKYLDLNFPGNSIVGYLRPDKYNDGRYSIYFKKTANLKITDNKPYFWLKA